MNTEKEPSPIEREVAKLIADGRVKKREDFLREFSMGAFDKAMAFNALIMSAGYVGEFALWDRVKTDLTRPQSLVIAAFLTISLAIFIGWHLKGQWTLNKQQMRFSQLISNIDAADMQAFDAALDKFRVEGAQTRALLQRVLPAVMGAAISFAALAAVTIVIACFDRIAAGR
jgi:hypothetical protein